MGMMINYLYRLDYSPSPRRSMEDSGEDDDESKAILLLHVKVYIIAEKFMIQGLKDLSLRKFKAAALKGWDTSEFLDAAKLAYSDTMEADRGLERCHCHGYP